MVSLRCYHEMQVKPVHDVNVNIHATHIIQKLLSISVIIEHVEYA